MSPTSIQLNAGEPTASLSVGDPPSPAPPIIWMWNDDAPSREHVSEVPKANRNKMKR